VKQIKTLGRELKKQEATENTETEGESTEAEEN